MSTTIEVDDIELADAVKVKPPPIGSSIIVSNPNDQSVSLSSNELSWYQKVILATLVTLLTVLVILITFAIAYYVYTNIEQSASLSKFESRLFGSATAVVA